MGLLPCGVQAWRRRELPTKAYFGLPVNCVCGATGRMDSEWIGSPSWQEGVSKQDVDGSDHDEFVTWLLTDR